MDRIYQEVTSELDAREILRYLNQLGLHNISGEVLKQFITDLKKLIKYDLEQKNVYSREISELPGPERLHSASTFCSRIRSKNIAEDAVPECSRECYRFRKPFTIRNIHSAPNIGQQKTNSDEKPMRRACSCVRVERKPESTVKESKITLSSNNIIKVPKQPAKKKCDPVTLYHYYTSLWAKYKTNVPGENDWADLRWSVRQKMAGIITKEHPMQKRIQDINPNGKQMKK